MTEYEIDFEYSETVYDTIRLDVDDRDNVELEAMIYIKDNFPEAMDVDIKEIKEVNG